MPLPIKWWNRLSVKLTVVIALVTAAAIGMFAIVALWVQQRRVIDQVVQGAALFSDTIKSSTYHDMLEDRREEAYRIMDTIGRQEAIERVRIFNKEGKVTFSTDRSEIGTFVDKRAESCYACHAAGQPIVRLTVPSRSRIFRHDDHRVLGMVTPIYNEVSCSTAACHVHSPAQRVLGVVDIGISLADIDRDVERAQNSIIFLATLSILALAALVSLYARRFVVKPVAQLVEGTHRIAQGDLLQQIGVRTSDEIGLLAASFNDMAQSLSRTRAERLALLENLERQVEQRTAALRQAQEQLIQTEKLSSLGKLAASIAHEINNPLSGILTYAKLVIRNLEEGQLDQRGRASAVRQLRLVQRETERCTAIVGNLLDFARQRPLTLRESDVNAAVEEALSLLGNQIALQEIRLEKHLETVPAVRADFGQLRQAFVNIILNACEAMGHGGTLAVSSRMLPAEQMIEVELRDNGPGIPPEHLPKILDPFFTTKDRGTGLGLSVVYGIIDRHGGKLDVKSGVGKGTSVIIRLPFASVARQKDEQLVARQ